MGKAVGLIHLVSLQTLELIRPQCDSNGDMEVPVSLKKIILHLKHEFPTDLNVYYDRFNQMFSNKNNDNNTKSRNELIVYLPWHLYAYQTNLEREVPYVQVIRLANSSQEVEGKIERGVALHLVQQ